MALDLKAARKDGAGGQLHRADMQAVHPPARQAGKMMMVALPRALVQQVAVYRYRLNLALLGQQFQGAVHGCYAQTRQYLLGAGVDFRHPQRPAGIHHHLGNDFALAGRTLRTWHGSQPSRQPARQMGP